MFETSCHSLCDEGLRHANVAAHLVSVKAEEVKSVFMRFVCDLERCGYRGGCVMRSDQDTALSGL